MSRVIMAIMGVTIGLTVATGAGAATGKWCFQWASDGAPYFDVFEDDGLGEDFDYANTYPARYSRVWIRKNGDKIWSNVLLNSSGCTGDWNIAPSTKYYFKQYTSAQVNGQDIDVYVLANGEGWDSTTAAVHEFDATTPSSVPSTITLPPPPVVDQTRVMPVISRMLLLHATLAWPPDQVLKISFDTDAPASCAGGNCFHLDTTGTLPRVCFAAGNAKKFILAHETGHFLAWGNDSARPNSCAGSEGPFRDPIDGYDAPAGDGSHQCDDQLIYGGVVSGKAHRLTSREFTGTAQGEGYAQFVASATFNHSTDTDGVFVYYKPMMKWSDVIDGFHGGTLPWPPPASGNPWLDAPQPIELSTGNSGENVQWLVYECDPSAAGHEVVDGFEHFGTEWDWMEFLWNLWTDPTDGFSFAEINDVWDATTEDARFCCNAIDLDPGAGENLIPQAPCAPRDPAYVYRPSIHVPGLSLQ